MSQMQLLHSDSIKYWDIYRYCDSTNSAVFTNPDKNIATFGWAIHKDSLINEYYYNYKRNRVLDDRGYAHSYEISGGLKIVSIDNDTMLWDYRNIFAILKLTEDTLLMLDLDHYLRPFGNKMLLLKSPDQVSGFVDEPLFYPGTEPIKVLYKKDSTK